MKLLAALIPLLMSVAGRILTALGLMAVTYAGVDRLAAHFQQAITHSITGASSNVTAFLYKRRWYCSKHSFRRNRLYSVL